MNHKKNLQKLDRAMNVRRLSQGTQNIYRGQVRLLLEQINKPAGRINATDIQHYFEKLANEDKLSTSALHVAYHATRYFFTNAIFKPQVMDRTPRIRRSVAPVLQLPDREETRRILQSVSDFRMRVVLNLIYSSGLRIGEAIRLRVQDIDSKNMRIHVQPGKTGRGRYTILSSKCLEELREYWKQYGHRNPKPDAYLFPARTKSGHICSALPRLSLKKAVESGTTSQTMTPHTLRHCFATHLLDSKVDIRKVQQLIGHASIRSTFRYVHLTCNALEGVTSPLDL